MSAELQPPMLACDTCGTTPALGRRGCQVCGSQRTIYRGAPDEPVAQEAMRLRWLTEARLRGRRARTPDQPEDPNGETP